VTAGDNPQPTRAHREGRRYAALPRSIWALGFVSMFMDISSELVHSLLPIFLTTVLGASMLAVGVIEGIAEATASFVNLFSGVLSDHFRKRKLLALIGYGLAAVTKPVLPLATSVLWVFTARFVDRIGKGIRGAPRDALVADLAPAESRGAAFGLRQALDSVGAFIGPLLAVVLMILLAGNIKAVLWVAVIPAVIAVLLLLLLVKEPQHDSGDTVQKPITLAGMRELSSHYWIVVAIGAVFTLARFSEAFLVLRAEDVGLAIAFVPAIMIVMNIVYAGLAYPAGAAADRLPANGMLVAGLLTLIAADLVLAMASSPLTVIAGAALWGAHMALTQGLLAKLVADTSPAVLRGTAFGLFNLVSGVSLLLASVIAGWLWSSWGAPATFFSGALFATIAAAGLVLFGKRSSH